MSEPIAETAQRSVLNVSRDVINSLINLSPALAVGTAQFLGVNISPEFGAGLAGFGAFAVVEIRNKLDMAPGDPNRPDTDAFFYAVPRAAGWGVLNAIISWGASIPEVNNAGLALLDSTLAYIKQIGPALQHAVQSAQTASTPVVAELQALVAPSDSEVVAQPFFNTELIKRDLPWFLGASTLVGSAIYALFRPAPKK